MPTLINGVIGVAAGSLLVVVMEVWHKLRG